MSDQVIFDGHKFTKDKKTGYYLKTTVPRKRLHIYVWEYYNGCEVPKGFDIHHKDLDKDNNDISNLECVSRSRHNKIHGELLTEEARERRRQNMNKNAQPRAIEWHKSEEGREWHKEQWENSLGKYQQIKIKKICECCGKAYEANYSNASTSRFCSNKCKSRYRRISGIDNITKVCIGCGKEYSVNKYHAKAQQYCSSKCADKYGRR